MGGKKKLNLKQMERMQDKKDEHEKTKEKKKEKTGPPKERKTNAVIPPDASDQKSIAELKKMRVLTPYAVASKYNIRISAAKSYLRRLQDNGSVRLVSSGRSIKVYESD